MALFYSFGEAMTKLRNAGVFFRLTVCLIFGLSFFLQGCSAKDKVSENNFVGKWRSSKLETPVYLYRNGEWEIKLDNGSVLQYGVWEYKDKNIIWSFKTDRGVLRDVNPVLSVSAREFRLAEADKTTTTFTKLD